ncbi:phosphodiester glycosidase family protein [Chitinophaga pinensis]|uniref:Phosphodiester glycosidase domain-containing protein n=1 Tax=Chitinophaga pinensis (strain ATCC 43595 / DSM 2588 / LMG 13176 / NBRC 15968 / NCIMB 11800 / UQM 2034) TaxID=485918 RepID=A0A979G6I7_CHIPD|nr:phosphodiester glycosidase family protein [Chitinophaga pinensis]ACU61583.1 conserved hypothetical protein [Chitinophaga pinensis DSM 2588]
MIKMLHFFNILLFVLPFSLAAENHAYPYQEVRRQVNDTTTLMGHVGEITFTHNGQQYDAIVVNPAVSDISLHWLSADQQTPYKSIQALQDVLLEKKKDILMITNGGMFMKNNIPVGLFISQGRELRPIDAATDQPGNFYMQPNGVFYLDHTGPHVSTTTDYLKRSRAHSKIVAATQSGPMLVSKGIINAKFNPGSVNRNLRSGVGILSNGNVVFIISKEAQTTFYDFASIFKARFGCKDALYLDGAISKMYLKNSRPGDLNGDFGAMIAVTAR